MTVAVLAGTPLAGLQHELATHGQWVAFDPGRAARGATVGGLLATADGGPSRQLYGTLRELVIGATVVLADGTIARSGGHVIKNVAGYDLAKLFHGSLGTLGVLAELVLRLHPLPRATATLALTIPGMGAFDMGARIMADGHDPAALEWLGRAGRTDGRLLVRLDGTVEGVAQRIAAVSGMAAGRAQLLEDDAERAAWSEVDTVHTGRDGDTVLRVGVLPCRWPAVAAHLATVVSTEDGAADIAVATGIGVMTVRLHGGPARAHERVLTALHREPGLQVVVLRRDGLNPDVPAWGPPPPAIAVMRAVKGQFDPHDRFGAGRFFPWLDGRSTTAKDLT
jgi:glycolate oxidase FAD binding subunit